jgi:uncharacterized protein (TIGR04255 family)
VLERLPMADLPVPMRQSDPNLAFQPTLQLKNPSGTRLARIGEMVISWHALPPYPGWEAFQPEIQKIMDLLQSAVEDLEISRVGFRYLNFLKADDHSVEGLRDLTLDVLIGGQALDIPLNVAYQRDLASHRMTVRIATPEFVQPGRTDFSLLLDIDLNTDGTRCPEPTAIIEWVESAHTLLKEEFFTLLKPEILQTLVED